jgi:hypothetical protein
VEGEGIGDGHEETKVELDWAIGVLQDEAIKFKDCGPVAALVGR